MNRLFSICFVATALCFANAPVQGDLVVLNEWNAVSSVSHLDEELFGDSDRSDSTFGRIMGNGGNWFELLVLGSATESTVDMRGWTLNWVEEATNGTITLSDSSAWSNLRRGTLITIIETEDAGGQLAAGTTSTDGAYDPGNGDWHFNVSSTQEQGLGVAGLLSTTTNDGVAGEFSVGNDNWRLTINDAAGDIVSGPTGEGSPDFGGINSREVGKLEGLEDGTLSEWLAITGNSEFYNDGTSSTFGSANTWSGGANSQNFSSLRAIPEPSSIALLGLLSAGVVCIRRRGVQVM